MTVRVYHYNPEAAAGTGASFPDDYKGVFQCTDIADNMATKDVLREAVRRTSTSLRGGGTTKHYLRPTTVGDIIAIRREFDLHWPTNKYFHFRVAGNGFSALGKLGTAKVVTKTMRGAYRLGKPCNDATDLTSY